MPTDGTTFINPIGLGFTLLMGALMLALPRRYALAPVIILTCYMTMGERLMIANLNFTMIRILTLFGWMRLILRQEFIRIRLNAIDKALLCWTLSAIVLHTFLWQTWHEFINRLGLAYDAIGLYFLFRFLVRDRDDIVRVFRMMAIFVVPLAASMILEKISGRNLFAVFGGVPEFTVIRDGALRCQGPFAHPILSGTFGATTLPFFIGLWWSGGRAKLLSAIGTASAVVIMVTSASSGPVLAGASAIFALGIWRLRKYTRRMRWGLVLGLILLNLVMKAPVWFLIARVDVFNGSTGYHRAYLIDRAIANLPGWWLVGTKNTAAWGSVDDHFFDVTNAYLREGAEGGLLTMALFITIIGYAYRQVGRSVESLDGDRAMQLSVWAMGAALFAHTASYISVSYFDQNVVNWYLLLAMISTTTLMAFEVRQSQEQSQLQERYLPLRDDAPVSAFWEANSLWGQQP